MFVIDYQELERIAVFSIPIYSLLIVLIKISGKCSIAKMNNFDWIVTTAIGAIVGTSILSKSISISEALLAIMALFLLQFLTNYLASRFELADKILKKSPNCVLRGSVSASSDEN